MCVRAQIGVFKWLLAVKSFLSVFKEVTFGEYFVNVFCFNSNKEWNCRQKMKLNIIHITL